MERNTDRGAWAVLMLSVVVVIVVVLTIIRLPMVSGYIQDAVRSIKDEADKPPTDVGYIIDSGEVDPGIIGP